MGLSLIVGSAVTQEPVPPPATPAATEESAPPSGEPAPPPAEPSESATPPAATPAPSTTPAEEPLPQQGSFLKYCWDASPTFFVLMAVISILMVYLGVTNLLRLQISRLVPAGFVSGLDELLAERKFKEAYELVKKEEAPIGRVLLAGLDRLNQGYDRSMEAMLGTADEHRMKLDQSVSSVNVIAAVSPMLGLLGTVLGMIFAFQKIGLGTQIKPALLAQDIGLALVSTLEGLVIAIPAIVVYSYLRNRIAWLMGVVESTAESYLSRFAAAVKK
jgi:biopolymer transport protein ExbB